MPCHKGSRQVSVAPERQWAILKDTTQYGQHWLWKLGLFVAALRRHNNYN